MRDRRQDNQRNGEHGLHCRGSRTSNRTMQGTCGRCSGEQEWSTSHSSSSVTIPSNDHLEMRDDNSNISKFENRLKNILIERKRAGFEVHINLTAEAVLHGVPGPVVNQIADLIQRIQREGSWGMHDPEISEYSEDIATYVSDVGGISFSTSSLFVAAERGCWIPLDATLIEEGIRQKVSGKYSPKDSSGLVLVVGASSAIVQEQINTYRSSSNISEIPFSEVWIVPRFGDRTIALKRQS